MSNVFNLCITVDLLRNFQSYFFEKRTWRGQSHARENLKNMYMKKIYELRVDLSRTKLSDTFFIFAGDVAEKNQFLPE